MKKCLLCVFMFMLTLMIALPLMAADQLRIRDRDPLCTPDMIQDRIKLQTRDQLQTLDGLTATTAATPTQNQDGIMKQPRDRTNYQSGKEINALTSQTLQTQTLTQDQLKQRIRLHK